MSLAVNHMAVRPVCRSLSGSVRPVEIAGHKAAARHNANVTAKPKASFNHGTTNGVAMPPKKLTYRDTPVPHQPAITPKARLNKQATRPINTASARISRNSAEACDVPLPAALPFPSAGRGSRPLRR